MAIKHTLNEVTKNLSEKIQAGITVDAKIGKATFADKLFDSYLPEGITPALVESLKEYETGFVAAGAHAFGMAAIDAMVANNDLKSVTGNLPMGYNDSVDYTMDRSRQIPMKTGGTDTKHGILTTTLNMQAGNKHGDQFSSARALLAEHAAKLMAE